MGLETNKYNLYYASGKTQRVYTTVFLYRPYNASRHNLWDASISFRPAKPLHGVTNMSFSQSCNKNIFFVLICRKFIRNPYDLTCSSVVLLTVPTHITTKRTAAHLKEIYVAYAHAQKADHVTPLTDSLTPLYHGAFLIRETDITTGQGYTAGSSWTDTSVPPSQILSPWENRSAELFT